MKPIAVEPLHIAFCVNDNYVSYISVTIKSIVENNQQHDIYIHVLIDKISVTDRVRLTKTIHGYNNVKLNIHLVDDKAIKGLKTGVWTIYTWYRVLLPAILPERVKRVLYLDADTLVVTDLQELFSLDMVDKSIAASIDVQSLDNRAFDRCGYEPDKQYVCAGVLLMNLDYWRKNDLSNKLIDWAIHNHECIMFPDQDAINYICQDSKIVLPLRYGILNVFFLNDVFYQGAYAAQLRDCIDHPAIIHYAGCYPWIKVFSMHLMNAEWMKYNKMLPQRIRIEYIPRKWLFLKIIIWRIFHPFKKLMHLTADDVRHKLIEYDS